MRYFLTLIAVCFLLTSCNRDRAPDRAELLRLHETVLQAHRDGDLEAWMADEAELTLSVNRGSVNTLERQDRLTGRQPYLNNTTFTSYRDLIEPIVKTSDDGSLGWVIAEVEVIGETQQPDGSTIEFADVWAWIELYERDDDGWKRTGNVSNSRPVSP